MRKLCDFSANCAVMAKGVAMKVMKRAVMKVMKVHRKFAMKVAAKLGSTKKGAKKGNTGNKASGKNGQNKGKQASSKDDEDEKEDENDEEGGDSGSESDEEENGESESDDDDETTGTNEKLKTRCPPALKSFLDGETTEWKKAQVQGLRDWCAAFKTRHGLSEPMKKLGNLAK